ncbi:MAG TPA: GGDEF domain-containing protein [Xanthobacteraceae bacterium]|nr:GGDEF domain-containing protein [Xanthobacteraceae bacterium]
MAARVLDLDVRTLFIVSISVTLVLGFLLLFAWYQNREIRALSWWSMSHFVMCAGAGLLGARGFIPDVISIDMANVMILLSCGIGWGGARLFDDRTVPMSGVLAGAILWLLASQIPGLSDSVNARIMLSSVIISIYSIGTGCEIWRGRRVEPLISRWPLSATQFVHGAVYALRIWLVFAFPVSPGASFFSAIWFSIIALESLLYLIVSSFMILAMAKERSELVHKTNAMLDPLTNIPNRRAFLDAAMRRMRQRQRNPEPVTALLFDLDHFKSINDRFGHSVGDEVLRLFTARAAAEFRSTDIMGRLGGEEFGALLFGAGEGTAVATAERIRRALMVATADISGKHVDATVSVGIAVLPVDKVEDVSQLLSRADTALYLAKERGRNRVEVAGRSMPVAPVEPEEEFSVPVLPVPALRMVSPAVAPAVAEWSEEDIIEWVEPQQLRVALK